jgi:hypothetical protein
MTGPPKAPPDAGSVSKIRCADKFHHFDPQNVRILNQPRFGPQNVRIFEPALNFFRKIAQKIRKKSFDSATDSYINVGPTLNLPLPPLDLRCALSYC